MGLGVVVIFCTLAGCIVAVLLAASAGRRVVAGVIGGIFAVLTLAYIIAPVATIGSDYFLEAQLRLAALAAAPVLASAFLGSWAWRDRFRRMGN